MFDMNWSYSMLTIEISMIFTTWTHNSHLNYIRFSIVNFTPVVYRKIITTHYYLMLQYSAIIYFLQYLDISLNIHTHTHTDTHTHTHTHTYIYIYIYVRTHTCARRHAQTDSHTYACVWGGVGEFKQLI